MFMIRNLYLIFNANKQDKMNLKLKKNKNNENKYFHFALIQFNKCLILVIIDLIINKIMINKLQMINIYKNL